MIIQSAADSLAQTVGSTVGSQISIYLTLGLGFVSKYLTDGAKFFLGKVATLSDPMKAIVAFVFAQFATYVTAKVGAPVSGDINLLATSAVGTAVWGISMGWNALSKVLFKKAA